MIMEGVIVALIGVVGSVLVVLVEKGRKENARDHGVVANKLGEIEYVLYNMDEDLLHIETKIDNHLSDHESHIFGGFDLDDKKFKTGEKVKDKKHGGKKR